MKKILWIALLWIIVFVPSQAQFTNKASIEVTVEQPTFPEKYFSVLDFGAKEGGLEKCTKAFAEAINKATESGGGSKEIRFVNCKLNKDGIVYENCQNAAKFLVSESNSCVYLRNLYTLTQHIREGLEVGIEDNYDFPTSI